MAARNYTVHHSDQELKVLLHWTLLSLSVQRLITLLVVLRYLFFMYSVCARSGM